VDRRVPAVQDLPQPRVEPAQHLVVRGGEGRVRRGQLAAHARPLGALTGEQESRPAGRRDAADLLVAEQHRAMGEQ
jgi:hypothetical protein